MPPTSASVPSVRRSAHRAGVIILGLCVGLAIAPVLVLSAGASERTAEKAAASTSPPGGGHETASRRKADAGAITFGEVSLGSTVTTQYAAQGVVFSSRVSTVNDAASLTNPVLSGFPRFTGPVSAYFTVPGTTQATTVEGFSLDVGYINARDSVEVAYFDSAGNQLGSVRAQSLAFNRLSVAYHGVASFTARIVSNEPAGFAIDNLAVVREATGIRPQRMASMGDSYSSGEGLLPEKNMAYDCATNLLRIPYYQDTDVRFNHGWFGGCDTRTLSRKEPKKYYKRPARMYENLCHRHRRAYPNAIRAALGLGASQSSFVACSGAVTDDLLTRGQYDNPGSPINIAGGQTQLSTVQGFAAGGMPDFVTVGVGGNDAGFADIITACLLKSCLADPTWSEGVMSTIRGSVYDKVLNTYRATKTAFPLATIAAFGYPQVVGDPATDCAGLHPLGFQIEESERSWLKNDLLPTLNSTLADAATAAGVTYVDISTALAGHELCSNDPYVNALRYGTGTVKVGGREYPSPVVSESFHPNQRGHDAITQAFMQRYTSGGRLIFANPAPADPLRPQSGTPVFVGHVDVTAVNKCGNRCSSPGPCVRNCVLRVDGSNYVPGTSLRVEFGTTPTVEPVARRADVAVAVATVDAAGRFSVTKKLPRGVDPGLYSINVTGASAIGEAQTGSTFVEVFKRRPPSGEVLKTALVGAMRQRLKGGGLRVACATSIRARCAVTVKAKAGGRTVKAKGQRVLRYGGTVKVRVSFTSRELRALRMAAGKDGRIKIQVIASATAGKQHARDRRITWLSLR